MKTNLTHRVLLLTLYTGFVISACGSVVISDQASDGDGANSQSVLIPVGVETVEAVGVLRSAQSADLSWTTTGIVETVYIELGQIVDDGELLAELEMVSVSKDVILAENSLYQANAALDELYDAYDSTALAELASDFAGAQQAVHDAERLISDLTITPDQNTVDQAYANMIIAEGQLSDAEHDLAKHIKDKGDRRWTRPFAGINAYYDRLSNFEAQVSQKQFDYDQAVEAYTDLINGPDSMELAVVQADLEVAQQQVLDYQAEYERLLQGPSQAEISSYEAMVSAAQAAADAIYLEAPFAGTATRLEVQAGDPINSGELAVRLDDLSTYFVDVEILEVDRNKVEVGQSVEVVFDALPGQIYAGEVSTISQANSTTEEIASYSVSIVLLETDEAFRPGMTASISIFVE
ncbi:MAG: HlyD family efflux transporter periplasmic adaptor subunit [Chloroflexi bacterium]|nr:HlyD family efflux transporter periplasmic adaptor subunit [Chloroflexota bacterium]